VERVSKGMVDVLREVSPRNKREEDLVVQSVFRLMYLMSEAAPGETLRLGIYKVEKVTDDLLSVSVALSEKESVEAGLERLAEKGLISF